MKIVLLILLTSCTLLNAEYKRHKYRGPPHPPRIPPSQQFQKKWHQPPNHPPRNPVRSRPIPVHMPPAHKIPMGVPPPPPPRAGSPPIRNFWKNSPKYQSEKPYVHRQEKPFLAAPSINAQEFDYHIQTNSIPTTHTNPIKQVGEKGPIHTIPAPNLSPRDKPAIIEDVRYEQVNPYHQLDQNHQYQVTEQPEIPPKQKLYRAQQQQLLQQQLQQQQLQQQQQQQLQQQQQQQQQLIQQQMQLQQEQFLQKELQKQVDAQPQQLYYTTDPAALAQALPLPSQKANQGEIYLSSRLNPKELYQIIGAAYPQLQTQVPSQDAQQLQNYQTVLTQQLFQPQSDEVPQGQTDKDIFQPEFHSFNYDEQAHQKSKQGLNTKDFSSLVSAGYNLDSSADDTKVISDRNSLDPLAQAQLIQSYFDTRTDIEENDVEPDAKPSQGNAPEKIKKELLGSSYYSSLPNKEAAERLADLQAAGQINSSLMKISSGQQDKDPMTIYVPEEDKDDSENSQETSKEQPVEYDDYSQEEESEEHSEEFGQKVSSKD